MGEPIVHMSSDSAQTQRLAQEFAEDLDQFIMVPSQAEQAHHHPTGCETNCCLSRRVFPIGTLSNHQPKFLLTKSLLSALGDSRGGVSFC